MKISLFSQNKQLLWVPILIKKSSCISVPIPNLGCNILLSTHMKYELRVKNTLTAAVCMYTSNNITLISVSIHVILYTFGLKSQ